jgi:hypothetical protein
MLGNLCSSLVMAMATAGLVITVGVTETSAAVQQATPATVRVTAERANVRESATTNGTIIATVARGEQLDVLGTSGAWYRVRLRPSNREGYIAMSTVEAVRATGPTPAPTPAAPAPPQAAPQTPRPATPATQTPPAARPPAQAARPRTPARATPAPNAWHVRGFVGGEGYTAAATDTFTALLGTPTFSGFTAGADVYGGALPFGLFARVGLSKFSADGERVFVVDGETFGTGIPLTVKMTPVQIGAGIRYPLGRRTGTGPRPFSSRLTPYGGAGLVMLSYQELSEFADDGDNEAESFKGLSIFGGLDVSLTKFLSAGIEVEFRQISGFGTGGVSQEFGEDQLGGTSFKFLIGIGR